MSKADSSKRPDWKTYEGTLKREPSNNAVSSESALRTQATECSVKWRNTDLEISKEVNCTDRLLRINQVIAPIGPVPVSKSTWWLWTRTGYAPPPVRISKRITTWRESEIRDFVARHSAQREG